MGEQLEPQQPPAAPPHLEPAGGLLSRPLLKMGLRMAGIGLAACVASLQADLPGLSQDELIQAGLAGYLAAATYAGLGIFTPLEPSIGPRQ